MTPVVGVSVPVHRIGLVPGVDQGLHDIDNKNVVGEQELRNIGRRRASAATSRSRPRCSRGSQEGRRYLRRRPHTHQGVGVRPAGRQPARSMSKRTGYFSMWGSGCSPGTIVMHLAGHTVSQSMHRRQPPLSRCPRASRIRLEQRDRLFDQKFDQNYPKQLRRATLVGTTTYGEGDRIGPGRTRSDIRLLGEGCLSRSAQPGPRNPACETITRTPAATSPQARLTSPVPRP